MEERHVHTVEVGRSRLPSPTTKPLVRGPVSLDRPPARDSRCTPGAHDFEELTETSRDQALRFDTRQHPATQTESRETPPRVASQTKLDGRRWVRNEYRVTMGAQPNRVGGNMTLVVARPTLDAADDDLTVWLSRPVEERIAAVEVIRRRVFGGGDNASGPRLQRVCRVVQRP